MEQKIKTIIVTHKDRFVRVGYDWFEKFCVKFNTTIVTVNNEGLSSQEERDEEIAKELQDGNKSDTGTEPGLTRPSELADMSIISILHITKLYMIKAKSL